MIKFHNVSKSIPIEGKILLNNPDAINQDIVKAINSSLKKAIDQTKTIAHEFKADTAEATAYNIWTFLKSHIKYERDPGGKQIVRLPSNFINEKKGDCKSYSVFTAAILHNLGYNYCLRYVSYDNYTTPTHVYVVMKNETNNDIIIDGVYKYFNKEKKYTHKKDYCMKVYTISGTDEIGKIKLKGALKNLGQGIKKAGLAPNRGAFLVLVRLNVKNLARKLDAAIIKDAGKVKAVWEKIGGNYTELVRVVNEGKNKKMIGEAVTAASIAGALVAAAPILAAVTVAIKNITGDKELETTANESTSKYESETGKSATDAVREAAAEKATGFSFTKPLIGAAAGAAAGYFIGKKKIMYAGLGAVAGAAAGYFIEKKSQQ